MGLTKITALHEELGRPLDRFETVHVAGTNGKGSVCLKVARALTASGYRTGLFISPHLFSYRERAQVDGKLIGCEETEMLIEEILSAADRLDIVPSFFEVTTMLALLHFDRSNVDCAVLETGLGGRLDCTNICRPAVSCITSIGLDHTRVLGGTLLEIASEKAGIMKSDVPVVLGPHFDDEVLEYLCDRARIVGCASLIHTIVDSGLDASSHDVPDALRFVDRSTVRFDAENSAMARHVLKCLRVDAGFDRIDDASISIGVNERPPCRFQHLRVPAPGKPTRHVDVVVDAAHNALGMAMLRDSLDTLATRHKKNLRFVVCLSEDKCAAEALRELLGRSDDVNESRSLQVHKTFHFAQSQHRRAAPATTLRDAASSEIAASSENHSVVVVDDNDGAEATADVESVLERALNAAAQEDEILVVCGSLYMMSEVARTLDMGIQAFDPVFKGKRVDDRMGSR
eukprot:g2581.t1